MKTYLYIYFGTAFVAVFLTPAAIWLARRIGAMDTPGIRSVHTVPVPRIGGVAIYVSAMCGMVALLFLPNAIGEQFRQIRLQVVVLLAAATGVFLIGLVDDLRPLRARYKFLVELIGAAALCVVGVRIGDVDLGGNLVVSFGWFAYPLTLLWIVGVTNAVNMSDGLDGLAAGVSAIACAVIAVFALYGSRIHTGDAQTNDVMMALLALALLGGLSGFLLFNANPAKVFMGDCGSLFIGFTIASMSVMCVSKSAALIGLAMPVLALGIPIFDTLFAMLRRFLEGRSVFAADRRHLHHRLIEMGLTQRGAVACIYAATLLSVGMGLFMLAVDSISSVLVFGSILLMIVLLFRAVGIVRLHETIARLKSKYIHSRSERDERKAFEHLQLQFRQARDSDQWWKVVCEAGGRMGFAWISLKTTYEDGRVDTEIWRSAGGPPPDMSRVVTMTIPFRNGNPHATEEFEIAVRVGVSLEATGRKMTLFGRLMDEHAALAGPTMQRPDLKN